MLTIVFTTVGKVKKEFVIEALDSLKDLDNKFISEIIIFDSSLQNEFSQFLKHEIEKRNIAHTYVQNTERLSMGSNWNKALEKVSTPWVLFHHDDDVLNIAAVNSLSSLDIKYSMYIYGYETLNVSTIHECVPAVEDLSGMINRTPKFISTIINVQRLRELGGWSDKFGYFLDYVGMLQLASLCAFKSEKVVLGKYRLHEQNASHVNLRYNGYAKYLHEVIHKVYPLLKSEELKRSFLYHVCSYSFPNKTILQKIISKVGWWFGYKTWIS